MSSAVRTRRAVASALWAVRRELDRLLEDLPDRVGSAGAAWPEWSPWLAGGAAGIARTLALLVAMMARTRSRAWTARVLAALQRDLAVFVRRMNLRHAGEDVPPAEFEASIDAPDFSGVAVAYALAAQRAALAEVQARVRYGDPPERTRKIVEVAIRRALKKKLWILERVLRTELFRRANEGALAWIRAQNSIEPTMKILEATFDWRTGADSVLLDGQARPVDEPFYDEYNARHFMHPPNRPNDREVVLPWRASWGPYHRGKISELSPETRKDLEIFEKNHP